jgi:ribosomal protein S18 acetylase RimI-like enzyme
MTYPAGYQVQSMDVVIDPKHPVRYYYVLDENKRVVGQTRAELNETNSIWIGMLFIREDHRGKGLGKHLLELIESYGQFTNRHFLSLNVADSNEGAKRLYQKLGFLDFMESHTDYRQYIKPIQPIL